MSPNIPLTPAQEQVLTLIAAGVTVTGAAREAGIHRNTVGNWLRSSPAFRWASIRRITISRCIGASRASS